MRRFLNIYFHERVIAFASFQILFFTMMWLSKSVHLLYFEEQGAVVNFGLAYSTMALVGYLSFFTGHLTDVWGLRKSILCGTLLYALGMGLRIFPHSIVAVFGSGAIAGLGASMSLSALRVWMVSLASDESTAQMVGVRTSTTALGTAFGCFLVAGLPLLSQFGANVGYQDLLLTAAIGLFVLACVIPFLSLDKVKEAHVKTPKPPFSGLKDLFTKHRTLTLLTSVLGALTGLYVSFITPYLPLIMKEKGMTLVSIGVSTGLFALVRFIVDPLIARQVEKYKQRTLGIYLGAEACIALITAAFLLPLSIPAFVLFLVLRSCMLGVSVISEELLWLRIFPKDSIGLFFGLSQSSFLLGDFLGGLMSSSLYQTRGLDFCIQVVLIVMAVNVAVFTVSLRWYQQRKPQTTQEATA